MGIYGWLAIHFIKDRTILYTVYIGLHSDKYNGIGVLMLADPCKLITTRKN
jgi:hypothetical protein